jgi:broad specificity phosphatase PhoE
MRLLLVRHAVTAETGRMMPGPAPGPALSEDGRRAADSAGRALAGSGLTAIVTSPMRRCRQTAGAVARVTGIRPRVERGFADADFGSWSGRRLSDLRRLAAWRTLMASPSRFRFPDGETLEEVRHRAVATTERLVAAYPDDATVLVVSHGDVIRIVLCHYLGMPVDLVHRLEVAPISLSEVALTDGRVSVPRVNQRIVG